VLNRLLAEMGIPEPPLPAEQTFDLVDVLNSHIKDRYYHQQQFGC
jgi:hypothetical protein